MASFEAAVGAGCDAIELDLQLSRDGVPVVYHDRTLNKVGGGRRCVRTRTLEQLRDLDAGAWFGSGFGGQVIPTLPEILQRYAARTNLLLEIKLRGDRAWRKALLEAVVEQVRSAGAEKRVFLLSFDPQVLRQAARVAPELRRVLNIGRMPIQPATLRRRLSRVDVASVDVRGLTSSVTGALRRADRPLMTYTCNTAAEVERSIAAGALGLMSDRPGWLREYLRKRGLRG